MSSNVGLSTPRGSGTSGYVQRNLSVLKPRATGVGAPYAPNESRGPRQRKPDENILKHDRLREIEIKVLELRDQLEDQGNDEDEIDLECENLRRKLISDAERGGRRTQGNARSGRDGIKKYQVHELAEAKIKESDRLRKALGLRNDEIGGGGEEEEDQEHPMARQERKKREREVERAKADLEREEDEQKDRRRGRDSP